jgi:hypothetical protein
MSPMVEQIRRIPTKGPTKQERLMEVFEKEQIR